MTFLGVFWGLLYKKKKKNRKQAQNTPKKVISDHTLGGHRLDE